MRIGHGYDVHRLASGRDLILGGVKIDYEKGLDGHSDADVLLHAVMDALLGAAALRDIGYHFPDTDPAYKGADSLELLRIVGQKVAAAGYKVSNVDAVVLPLLRGGHDLQADVVVDGGGGDRLVLLVLHGDEIQVLTQQGDNLIHIETDVGQLLPSGELVIVQVILPSAKLMGHQFLVVAHKTLSFYEKFSWFR